jgi:hypothetical protein
MWCNHQLEEDFKLSSPHIYKGRQSEYGWYAAKNRGDNLNGCSRDHLYSVYDGFKNKIDPKIISHPANCEIKPHKENQHKHSKSSITIEQLLERISDFEKQYGTTI